MDQNARMLEIEIKVNLSIFFRHDKVWNVFKMFLNKCEWHVAL